MTVTPLTSNSSTEVATFFGPADAPLFGVLHLPADQRIRGGVLVCGSLGREGTTSVRFQRIMANDLAERGFAVLRFDYLGTGDSAYTQDHDEAVDNWVRSIGYAVEYLEKSGAQSITAVGLRAGSLILSAALANSLSINRVAYVDPIGTGRRYLREQTALFMVSAGADSVPAGTISIIGGRLTATAAEEFRKLRLNTEPSNLVDQLLVMRPGEPDAQLSALRDHNGTQTVIVDLLSEFSQPAKTLTPIPFQAIDAVVDWVDKAHPTARTSLTPHYQMSARIPTEGSAEARGVVESIESIGPGGLFAIRTRPEHAEPGHGTVWVFYTSSNDPHVGPAREWVELSRRVAESGAQALRWDRSGVGQSSPISRDQWQPVYARRDVQDAIAVAKHAAVDSRNLRLIGPCSGSWYAAHAAHELGAGEVVMVNPRVWTWRIGATRGWQWWNLKRPLRAAISSRPPRGTGKVATFWKRASAVISRESKKACHKHAPRSFLMSAGRLGLAQTPDVLLTTLARDQVATTVLLSPWDADLFDQRCGPRAIDRLAGAAVSPHVITTGEGDHAVYHQTMLQAIRSVVLERVAGPKQDVDGERVVRSRTSQHPTPVSPF